MHRIRVLVGVEGAARPDQQRTPLNLAVVLDTSSSMAGSKLQHAQIAALQIFGSVSPEDATSLVSFSTEAEVVAGAKLSKQQGGISERIQRMQAHGMTNLSGGWLEGRLELERFRSDQRANRLILMTDGQANQGITDPDKLVRLVAQARAQRVTTSTIGFGVDFDERLLRALADAGGGNTHYIEHPDQAASVFQSELNELLTLSAQNLSARLRLSPGTRLSAVHHTYPQERTSSGSRFRLGDLYASEPKQLLMEFTVKPRDAHAVPLAVIDVAGDVLTERGGLERQRLRLPIAFSPAAGPTVDPTVQRTLVYLHAARARRRALEEERQGLYGAAAARLRRAAMRVRDVGDARSGEEAADLELLARRLEEGAFGAAERKYANDRSYRASRSKMSTMDLLSRTRRSGEGSGDSGTWR